MNKTNFLTILFSLIGFSLLTFSCDRFGKVDYLKEGFLNPPDSARPGVYWYFMDGNLDRKAITEDLESMKKAGISYALFLEVNVGIPRGKVDFLSEEWQELFKHAVREAERLGIRIILGSGPGWAGSGGPWVKPEQSMMHLVACDTIVTGPSSFNGILKIPRPKKPFFGEGSLTPALKELRENWYEDVRVLAFPAPSGSGRIENNDDKALYYRAPYTSQPGVVPFIPTQVSYNESKESVISKEQIIDLTYKLTKEGKIQWDVPPGKWIIARFGKRNNGAVTRPAPVPGLGFEADKFDTASFHSHYNAYVGKLYKKVMPKKSSSGGGWTMIHIDSWEMGAQNWTNRFVEEFIKRRGYDPVLYLPVYEGYIINSKEVSERFLWDVRQTSNELVIENHAGWFKKLGKRNGFSLSIEPYDMNPSSDLDLGAVADIPMGEFWSDGFGFNSSFSCIEASSIGHVTGKPVVAAESFTADQNEAWKKFPGDMKNQSDWALSMGINRFVFHTFAHKPYGDKNLPGVTMGPYGVHWDRGQTWWPMVSAYHNYLARCQFILSQGKPVADILYLGAEGAPHVFRPPSTALEGTDVLPDKKGYSFDGCSPQYLINYAGVKSRRIVFPGGSSYQVLVLPDIKTMTPELITKIDILLKGGAVIIGNPPLKSPSLVNFPQCDAIVKSMANVIWGSNIKQEGVTGNGYFNGTVFRFERKSKNENLPSAIDSTFNIYPDYEYTAGILRQFRVAPDFVSSGNIRYIHRSTSDREIYFISNRTANIVKDTCTFRDGSVDAELWNPVNGEIKKLHNLQKKKYGISTYIELSPWQSYFVMFKPVRKGNDTTRIVANDFPSKKTLIEIKAPWTLEFNPAFGGPEKVRFDTLADLSKSGADGIKYYSGIVTYTVDFDLPVKPQNKSNTEYYIDLGKVKNIAKIKLNGEDLGIIWTDPWQVKTTGLKEKGNHLVIEVANLWINRLIGDEARPWDGIEDGKWPEWLLKGTPRTSGRYTFTTHRYYKKDDPLVESGLIGPVKILVSN
jgi:hypothetical protein